MTSNILRALDEFVSPLGISVIEKPWEAGILGIEVYALELHPGWFSSGSGPQAEDFAKAFSEMEARITELGPTLLTTRIPADATRARTALEDARFRLMECRLEFGIDLGALPITFPSTPVRHSTPDEVTRIVEIASTSLRDSRFHMDPLIDPALADLTRGQWARNACMGRSEAVLVAESGSTVAGFVACNREEREGAGIGRIDLIAVAAPSRRQRLGSDLVAGALLFFRSRGYNAARVGTQAHNIAAVRTYERSGFLLRQAYLSYHKHLSEYGSGSFHCNRLSQREGLP